VRKWAVALAVVTAAGAWVTVAGAAGSFTEHGSDLTAPAAVGTDRPTIYAVGRDPLRIRGSGFKAGEHVTVTAKGATASARVRTTAAARRGSFVTVLRGVKGCDSIDVTARGDRGSRASFNLSSFVCG
jgi:hypothetical protein